MNMGQWLNNTERGNWFTSRKILYCVCGRWINEYEAVAERYWLSKMIYLEKNIFYIVCDKWMNVFGTMVEWYRQGKLIYWRRILYSDCGSLWISMEKWWNDSEKLKLFIGEKFCTIFEINEWMCMEQWCNDTEMGKGFIGENNIKGLWWANEWVWSSCVVILRGEIDLLEEKYYKMFVVSEWTSMKQWLNDTDREK